MSRRAFLQALASSLPPCYFGTRFASQVLATTAATRPAQQCDVLVVGGGLGGCAAALAVLRDGQRVILTEETDWLGGQLTSQAVPPDEHPWIESLGAPSSYRRLRQLIRQYYRDHYRLTDEARAERFLNPGAGSVSRLCVEPRVALAALYQMLAPYLSGGQLKILLNHRPVAVDTDGDRIASVTVEDFERGSRQTFAAPHIIDATELGDLLPLSGTEYVTGFESQRQTGEPHAPGEAQPHNMQAATWCFPVQYVHEQDWTIEKPEEYDFWKAYVPQLTPRWPGRLLDWTYTNPINLEPRTLAFDPRQEAPGWWRYRRIAARSKFAKGAYDGSISLVNWPQNDYLPGNLCEVSAEERTRHHRRAKQLSLSLLYWMQTAAPRPDGGVGWPGLRLRPQLVDTQDGLAKAPYVRESRRLQAQFTVVEQHVSTASRMEITGLPREDVKAASFPDSVGVGSYRIDLHPSTGGDNYIDLSSLPFEIPLGALLPQRVENLIAGAKNLGVTHITNGCYRLHPVEWNVGESAGALAAYCNRGHLSPREVRSRATHLEQFQKKLTQQGVEIRWPDRLTR